MLSIIINNFTESHINNWITSTFFLSKMSPGTTSHLTKLEIISENSVGSQFHDRHLDLQDVQMSKYECLSIQMFVAAV